MPLKLPKRHGQLHGMLNIQAKVVKEETFARFGIPIFTTLTPDEFGEVILSDRAPKVFWKKIRARESQPMFPNLGAFALAMPIRQCTVSLWLHDRIMKLTDTTITGSRFVVAAANVNWAFKLQAMPAIDDALKDLFTTFSQPILISIDCPTWGAQQELPLEEEEDEDEKQTDGFGPEDPEGKTAEQVSSIEKQIAEGAAKKKRAKAKRARKAKS